MNRNNVVSALERKHRDLMAELKGLEARIGQIKAQAALLDNLEAQARDVFEAVAEVEMAIRLVSQSWTPSPVMAAPARRGRRP